MKNFVYLVVLLGVVACNAAVGSSTRNIRNQPEKSTAEECKRKYTLTPESVHQIPHAFKRHRISPKLTAPPNELLSVDYANLTKCQPNLGNEVNICNITQAPNIVWNCRKDQLYTLFLIDMHPLGDAQPALLSEGILWWVVNIPGCEIAKGKSVYEYQPPLPLYGAGHGKYVFLVYEQPERVIDWSEEYQVTATSESHRYYKCVDKLVNKYKLELIAGNFFVSEFEPCVLEAAAKLDSPTPQYIIDAVRDANLPPYLVA